METQLNPRNKHDVLFSGADQIFYHISDETNRLVIAGPKWKEMEGRIATQRDQATKLLQSQSLKYISQSETFHERLLNRKDPHAPLEIYFFHVWLHDWKPLLQTLRQHNVPVTMLVLGSKNYDPSSFCPMSKMGAETLGWALNPKKSGFQIETLCLYSRHTSRAIHSKWMHGMMPNENQRRVVRSLILENASSWFLPHLLLENCRFRNVYCKSQAGDDDAEMISFVMRMGNNDTGIDFVTVERKLFTQFESGLLVEEKVGFIQSLEIQLDHNMTPAACQSLAVVLSSTRIQSLLVLCHALKREIDYDHLFKSAEMCNHIAIEESPDVNYDLFPCDGLTSCLHETFGVFNIFLTFWPYGFEHDRKISNGQRHVGLGMVLKKTNLSLLDGLQVELISKSEDTFSAICHQLKENKGPKQLKISIDNKHCHEEHKNDDEALEKLGESLRGNDKVKDLHIEIINLDLTASVLLQFIRIVFEDMPGLSRFILHPKMNQNDHQRQKHGDVKCDAKASINVEYAQAIASNVEEEKEMKNIVLQLISKNNNITHVQLPFDDNGLGLMMSGIAKFRSLSRCGNDTRSLNGIWSHALSCTKIVTPNVMLRVLQQMPSLLQRTVGNDDNLLPLLTVPHHPNCPACRRKDKNKVHVLKGRYCKERFIVYSKEMRA